LEWVVLTQSVTTVNMSESSCRCQLNKEETVSSKLWRIFKSKQWTKSATTKEEEDKFTPFTLPKLKLRKEDSRVLIRSENSWEEELKRKANLQRAKSCPSERPKNIQIKTPSAMCMKHNVRKVSVGTQTEENCFYFKKASLRPSVRQVSFSDEASDPGKLTDLSSPTDSYDDIREMTSICRKRQPKNSLIKFWLYPESEMISPTTSVEESEEDNTDSDGFFSSDDDTSNIYEEILNIDHTHRDRMPFNSILLQSNCSPFSQSFLPENADDNQNKKTRLHRITKGNNEIKQSWTRSDQCSRREMKDHKMEKLKKSLSHKFSALSFNPTSL